MIFISSMTLDVSPRERNIEKKKKKKKAEAYECVIVEDARGDKVVGVHDANSAPSISKNQFSI